MSTTISPITSLVIPEEFGTFDVRPHFIIGAKQGRIILPNGWRVSAITGPAGCGIHGDITQPTFEVATFNPSGALIGDVLNHQTSQDLIQILREVATF